MSDFFKDLDSKDRREGDVMNKHYTALAEVGYLVPPKELLPELMLLGELTTGEAFTDEGDLYKMDVIIYQGKNYVMRFKHSRWFDQPVFV